MQSELTVRDVMHEADNLIVADEPVQNALPQFELEATRSLILVDDAGPAGVLTRRRAGELSVADRERPARDFALDVPVLEQSQLLTDARRLIEEVDFEVDRVPVVNSEGSLVGAVDRDVLLRQAETSTSDRGVVQISGATEKTGEMRAGMEVRGSSDEKLGKVDEIVIEREYVSSFTVAHGLLGRSHKRVTADHVAGIEDDTVRLDFGKTEFRFLADIKDQEEAARPVSGY